MELEGLAARIRDRSADVIVARGEVTLTVDREEVASTLSWLRDEADLAFDHLSDVSCTDWPGRDPRVWMAYHLASSRHGHAVRVKTGLPATDLRVRSLVSEWPAAEWQEREVFDLFGVTFDGHPDLRRILMPDGWEGHPLRKDHPLGGVPTPYKGGVSIPPPDEREI